MISGTNVTAMEKVSGKQYVVYFSSGGSATLNLSNSTTLNSSWFNTTTGIYQNYSTITANSSYPFTSPDTNDWALLLVEESTTTQKSNITIPSNSWGIFNNWTSNETFLQIATNESNDVAYSYYNVSSGLWEDYYVGYTYNSNNIINKDNSVMAFFDSTTTISATTITPVSITIPIGWNMLYVEGTDNETISNIKADMGVNTDDVWRFNTTLNIYSNTITESLQPNEGFLAYVNTGYTWTRSGI